MEQRGGMTSKGYAGVSTWGEEKGSFRSGPDRDGSSGFLHTPRHPESQGFVDQFVVDLRGCGFRGA